MKKYINLALVLSLFTISTAILAEWIEKGDYSFHVGTPGEKYSDGYLFVKYKDTNLRYLPKKGESYLSVMPEAVWMAVVSAKFDETGKKLIVTDDYGEKVLILSPKGVMNEDSLGEKLRDLDAKSLKPDDIEVPF